MDISYCVKYKWYGHTHVRRERFLVINLNFVDKKFARMKKIPYLCTRYNILMDSLIIL